MSPQECRAHGSFDEPVLDPLGIGFLLAKAHVSQFRAGEQNAGDLTTSSALSTRRTDDVAEDDAVVVPAHVGEVRAARTVSCCKDVRDCCLQLIVDRDVAGGGDFNPCFGEIEIFDIRSPTSCDEEMRAVESSLRSGRRHHMDCDFVSVRALNELHSRPRQETNALIDEDRGKAVDDILVFLRQDLGASLDDSDLGAKSTIGLGELQPHITTPDDDQMRRQSFQIQNLDVCYRPRLNKPRDPRVDHRPRASADDNVLSRKKPPTTDLHKLRRNKPPLPPDQLNPKPLEKILKPINRLNHLVLAFLHNLQVRFEVLDARDG